jgi:hypothetical protein
MGSRSGIVLQDVGGLVSNHGERLGDLERRGRPQDPGGRSGTEVVDFVFTGALVVETSPIHPVVQGGRLIIVNYRLIAAGGTGPTFRILKDGVLLGSAVTLTAGSTSGSVAIGDSLYAATAADLQADITGAGAGNIGLTLQVLMR